MVYNIIMKTVRKTSDNIGTAAKTGQVHLNQERCKGCGYCVDFCPRGVLKMSDELNTRGYLLPAVDDETRCTACGYCEALCPEFAIKISAPRKSGAS
jgi:2-oxoglutarate ferredoxin oxidoreductase subunit delta